MKKLKNAMKILIPVCLFIYGTDQKSFLWILLAFLLVLIQLYLWAFKKRNANMKSNVQNQNYIPSDEYIELSIAGINYEGRMERLKQWMDQKHKNTTGRKYGDKVYKYDRVLQRGAIKLIPEPDNPYDKNAIQCVHKELGVLGYIPADQTEKIRKNILRRVDLVIYGGGYYLNGVDYPDEFKVRIHVYE